MLGKSTDQNNPQRDLFLPLLSDFINLNHSLVKLSQGINWLRLEKDLRSFILKQVKTSLPVRLMAGLLIYNHMFNLSDERLVKDWLQSPYYQFFTGNIYFDWNKPCDPSELVHFRKRIGKKGIERIFQMSVELHTDKVAKSDQTIIDTTVQEKNISFPTDTNLALKIIDKCCQIADKEQIKLRQNYKRVIKREKIKLRFSSHPRAQSSGKKSHEKDQDHCRSFST